MPALRNLQNLLAGSGLPPKIQAQFDASRANLTPARIAELQATLPPSTATRAEFRQLVGTGPTSIAEIKRLISATAQLHKDIRTSRLANRGGTPAIPGAGTSTTGGATPVETYGNPLTNPLSSPGAIPVFPTYNDPTAGTGLGALGNAACNLISDPKYRAACLLASSTLLGGGGGGSSTLTAGCPDGYESDGKGGCVIKGMGRYLPGDIGRPDYGWQPVAGLYGIGATPLPVQRTVRACPPGFVLGKDGVCYDHLTRSNRAHNPGARPMLTGGDMNALRKAHSLRKKVGKLFRQHGNKPAPSCAPRKRAR